MESGFRRFATLDKVNSKIVPISDVVILRIAETLDLYHQKARRK